MGVVGDWARAGAGMAVVLVVAGLMATIIKGPLPWFGGLSAASPTRLAQYSRTAASVALDEAAAMIPDGAVVSAGNNPGGHLSSRRRILVFPEVGDAQWVLLDRTRPHMYDRIDVPGFQQALDRLANRPDFQVVFNRDGVVLFRRVPAGGRG